MTWTSKEDQPEEASTTDKCTEHGMFYKQQVAPNSNNSPIEPDWEDEDSEDDESWNDKRGSNKNPTTGVKLEGSQGGTVKK